LEWLDHLGPLCLPLCHWRLDSLRGNRRQLAQKTDKPAPLFLDGSRRITFAIVEAISTLRLTLQGASMAEDTDHSEETADPLVDALRQRQQPAWDALVTEVRPQLVGLAQRQLGSPDNAQLNAESIVQNALLRAWQKADQVQCDNRAQLVAWLGEIVRTTAVDAQRFRRRKKRDATREQALPQNEQGEVQVAGPSSTPSNKAMRNEEEQQLQTRLELLSVADRDL